MNFRPERVSNLIREELGKILMREMEFPGLVTITGVSIDKKLEGALVGISVIPSEKSHEVIKMLKKGKPRLQFLLLRKINIKPMPELRFEIDYGLKNAAQVEKLLLEDKEEGD